MGVEEIGKVCGRKSANPLSLLIRAIIPIGNEEFPSLPCHHSGLCHRADQWCPDRKQTTCMRSRFFSRHARNLKRPISWAGDLKK